MAERGIIETPELVLRPYCLGDLDALYAVVQEEAIRDCVPGWNVPKERRRAWLAQYEIPQNDKFLRRSPRGFPLALRGSAW